MMKKLAGLFLFLLIISSCTFYNKVSNQNLYYSYRKEFNTIHPDFSIYHNADSTSSVNFSFPWKEFLFIHSQEETGFKASARITWKLSPGYDSKIIADSGSFLLSSTSPSAVSDKIALGSFNIPLKSGSSMLLELTVQDVLRNQFARQFITADKTNNKDRQNFLLSEAGAVLIKDHINKDAVIDVTHRDEKADTLYVRFYQRDFPLAPPPFSEYTPRPFQYKADSVFTLWRTNSGRFVLPVMKEGFYHLLTDSTQKEGYTLFRVHDDYPALTTAGNLLEPLRYITSKKEFEEMNLKADKKAAIDEFWLNNGGNNARARELIKTFYNRVQDANIYFHSYLEGWKTDRGLLYIIYGPPSAVYKTETSESWVYGEENNIRSLHFSFVKVINPFTENDYSLIRNENYKDSWYIAVDTWRQGRVFSE